MAAMVQGAVTALGYVEGFQKAVENVQGIETVMIAGGVGGAAIIAGGGAAAAGGLAVVLGAASVFGAAGGVLGGYLGNEVAEDADTLWQAAEMAKDAVLKRALPCTYNL
ncbi:hypothetical protein EYF80_066716 [Liparis tanakae]|uniref:Uncharacterized protein n=1 Tax=Liparis tanakae TaxID=230148 RepID=A0A4Z2E2N0_9TELE|nr:hypothetical protein EYF80_066716 [Liparis tanakae]